MAIAEEPAGGLAATVVLRRRPDDRRRAILDGPRSGGAAHVGAHPARAHGVDPDPGAAPARRASTRTQAFRRPSTRGTPTRASRLGDVTSSLNGVLDERTSVDQHGAREAGVE